MSRFVVRPEAVADLETIEDYIARDDVEQACLFLERLYDAMTLVSTQPHMGRLRPGLGPNVRSFRSATTSSSINSSDGIDVVRVLSGARDIDAIF